MRSNKDLSFAEELLTTLKIVATIFGLGLCMGGPLGSNIYAQSPDELRQEFERKLNELRQEFERKLQEAVEREVAKVREEKIQQETNSSGKQTPEAQAPQVLLAPAPTPPAASTPALGWFFNVDFQAINFWGTEGPFAARKPVGLNAAIPTGRWRTVDVDRDFSARPTLGYYLPNGGGILSANFFHVNTTGRASFSDPVSFLVGPGNQSPFELNNVISASSRNNVEMNQFDLQYQYPVQVTRNFTLTPELGVRGVFFNNSVATKYATDTSAVFTTNFMSKSGAGGPKIGLTAAWEFGKDWTLSAGGTGGYLLGRNRAKQVCNAPADFSCGDQGGFNPSSSQLNENRGFPFIGGDFSITYQTPWKGLSTSVGYRLMSFFEMTTRMREISASAGDPTVNIFEQRNLTTDAIYYRLQYLW